MYGQFFGNYLLSNSLVTPEQLFEAIHAQSSIHLKLGTLAIHEGLMTADEVEEVILQQTHEDKKFGEIAVEQGYLTNDQVIHLLKAQSPDFLLLGQALVEQGVFSNSDLENIIADYRVKNEIFDLDISEEYGDFQKLFDNFFLVSETPVSKCGKMYMKLLFNNFIRFIGEDFTPISVSECLEYPTDRCVFQRVNGAYSVVTYLDMSSETAIEFASRYTGDEYNEYDDFVKAAMEDFVNLHNGLFAVNVSNDTAHELTLDAPESLDEGLLTFEGLNTYHFTVLYSFGTVHMVLEIIQTC